MTLQFVKTIARSQSLLWILIKETFQKFNSLCTEIVGVLELLVDNIMIHFIAVIGIERWKSSKHLE
jgi:hypothetical protein